MNLRQSTLLFLVASTATVSAFTTAPAATFSRTALAGIADSDIESTIAREIEYAPGSADHPFAKRFAHLKGTQVKTVGEAFASFTSILGTPVNALYKNMMTDIVGTTHLTVVNARFVRDPVWSLGMISSLDLLLKNYPEQETAKKIVSSLFECVDLDEKEVRAEAEALKEWAKGKSKDEISQALSGEGDSLVAATSKAAKADEYWMYSRFFGIGLVALMDDVGVEMNADDVYPVMEEWMKNSLGKSHFTACSDSDTYFKIKGKLDMMETMMKEIEIREKKRMAERLEDKAEAALRKAERDAEMAQEELKEAESKKEESTA
jgi:hypothetical protein